MPAKGTKVQEINHKYTIWSKMARNGYFGQKMPIVIKLIQATL